MDKIPNLKNFWFVYHIPGSCGSLLSVLLRSQIEKDFVFTGFNDNTAHAYLENAFNNTHSYASHRNFKKSNIDINQHLQKNYRNNNSIIQLSDINWFESIRKTIKSNKNIICYISDQELAYKNFFQKDNLAGLVGSDYNHVTHPFNIKKTHKKYKQIIVRESLYWYLQILKKKLNQTKSIDILEIIQKKNFSILEPIFKITNKKLLNDIVDDYNKNQK